MSEIPSKGSSVPPSADLEREATPSPGANTQGADAGSGMNAELADSTPPVPLVPRRVIKLNQSSRPAPPRTPVIESVESSMEDLSQHLSEDELRGLRSSSPVAGPSAAEPQIPGAAPLPSAASLGGDGVERQRLTPAPPRPRGGTSSLPPGPSGPPRPRTSHPPKRSLAGVAQKAPSPLPPRPEQSRDMAGAAPPGGNAPSAPVPQQGPAAAQQGPAAAQQGPAAAQQGPAAASPLVGAGAPAGPPPAPSRAARPPVPSRAAVVPPAETAGDGTQRAEAPDAAESGAGEAPVPAADHLSADDFEETTPIPVSVETGEEEEAPVRDSLLEVDVELGAPEPDIPPADRKPPPPRRSAAPSLPRVQKPRKKPWWETLFGDDFSRAYRPMTPTQVGREVDFIQGALELPSGSVILDLGCGQGETCVELSRRGFSMVGYDLSVYQLAMAGDNAQRAHQKINFLQGDMREMAFEQMFDAVVSWDTSFGYFEEEKNIDVLRRIKAALKPGGRLLLDVLNRDFVAREAPYNHWFEGDGCVCMDDMAMDWITNRLKVKRSIILDDGRSKELQYSVRLYGLSDVGRMLHDVGFRVSAISGDVFTPGAFFGPSSRRIIITANKP